MPGKIEQAVILSEIKAKWGRPRKKVTPKKALQCELDELGHDTCKKQWAGRCGICGRAGKYQHHYFGKKAYPWLRWDSDNLVFLCWQCHICRVHHEGESERARDAIIERIGQEGFDRLKIRASQARKLTLLDLDALKLSMA